MSKEKKEFTALLAPYLRCVFVFKVNSDFYHCHRRNEIFQEVLKFRI